MALTPQQIKNVATGFVHVLTKHPDVYNGWASAANTGDTAKMGQFIQNAMGLQSVPTVEEMTAMDQHISNNMADDVAAFHEEHPDAPVVEVCGLQQGP